MARAWRVCCAWWREGRHSACVDHGTCVEVSEKIYLICCDINYSAVVHSPLHTNLVLLDSALRSFMSVQMGDVGAHNSKEDIVSTELTCWMRDVPLPESKPFHPL